MHKLRKVMPKSKKDKSREAKVVKFKESVKQEKEETKKTMEIPKIRPFRQVPTWEPDAEFSLTGEEFNILQDFFNIFAEPIQIMQGIFARNLNSGKIVTKYLDNEGKEVDKEEVQAYIEQMKQYFESQRDATAPEVDEQVEEQVEQDLYESINND